MTQRSKKSKSNSKGEELRGILAQYSIKDIEDVVSKIKDDDCECSDLSAPKLDKGIKKEGIAKEEITYISEPLKKGSSLTFGQDLKVCDPKKVVVIHSNDTTQDILVSGDLVVDQGSCNVHFHNGTQKGSKKYSGIALGITLEVKAGALLTGHCHGGKTKKCKWSYTRTSP